VSIAARLLKSVCYSSRPQWDDSGHLSCSSQGKHPQVPSLEDRFGPDIWARLKGKRVLDFGCGYGTDVRACASHGISAAGLEARQFLVDGARQRAEKSGADCLFYHTSDCPSLAGAFDCILSVNCFEHYLDPGGVLESMRQLLKPTGVVLAYFSPPWLHPYGAHSQQMTALPWIHLIFPESAVMSVRAEYYDEKPTSYEEAAGGLNRMTIAKFKRTVVNSPFVFRSFELLAIRKLNTMTKIPAVRELFTTAVRAELALRESAEQPAPRLR